MALRSLESSTADIYIALWCRRRLAPTAELSSTTTQKSDRREKRYIQFLGTVGLENALNGVWGIDKIPPMVVEISRVGKIFLGRTMLPEVSSDLSSNLN